MPISYDMLFGAPTEEEKARAMVNQLRRREAFATLGAMSGDPVLGEWGRGEMGNLREQAGALRKARQEATKAERCRPSGTPGFMMCGNEVVPMEGYAAQREAEAAAKRKHELNKMRLGAELEGEEAPEYRKMTHSMVAKESPQVDMVIRMQNMLNDFKDDYTQLWGPGPQSGFPLTLARQGIEVPTTGKEGNIEAQSWWADWQKFYEMVERHEFFGAALTPTERQAWEAANVGPEMGGPVIRERIQGAVRALRDAVKRREKVYRAEGYNPEALDRLFEGVGEVKQEETAEAPQKSTDISAQPKPEGVSDYDWESWLQENRGR